MEEKEGGDKREGGDERVEISGRKARKGERGRTQMVDRGGERERSLCSDSNSQFQPFIHWSSR